MRDDDEAHPSEQQLAAFDAGAMVEAEWSEVAAHVAGCAACCGKLDALPADALSARLSAAGSDEEAPDAVSAAPPVPAALCDNPRYQVLALLGRGGMGEVYLAEHRLMERRVALKVIRKRLLDRPAAVAQFREEVKAAARLAHPNIVTAHDADHVGDLHFLVMEYVPGASLDRVIAERGPLPVAQACACIRQAALGLQHAADRGMVHRDIKPHNLMLTPDGTVKILDFGLARFASLATEGEGSCAKTRGPTLTGTPGYIAPEQRTAPQHADTGADIYSLGCTFYYLLTGRVPGTDTEPVRNVPPPVQRILERMRAPERTARYAQPADVASALAAVDQQTPAPKRRRWLLAGIVAALVTITVIGIALRPRTDDAPTTRGPDPAPPANSAPHQPVPPPQPEPPAPAGPAAPTAPTAPMVQPPDLKARVAAWLRENNRHGPEHAMVGQLSARVGSQLEAGGTFELSLGGGLLKSGTPTLLCAWDNELFVLPYTPQQAQALELSSSKIEFRQTGARHDPMRAPPLLELAEPKIDAADALRPALPITGSVRYRWLGEDEGSYALRWRCSPGKQGTTRYFRLKRGLPEKAGTIDFSYGPLESAGTPYGGPIPVFFDVIRFMEPNRTDKVLVISNPVATLINVVPPDAK
jgi:serine/threonine protein kinase